MGDDKKLDELSKLLAEVIPKVDELRGVLRQFIQDEVREQMQAQSEERGRAGNG